ncbi:MAG: mechanosensitive ion channel family protein [Geobacteraceae bacterium]|nr:mechanosensitive ion channel family protein [Geobacteraceae bacterium]
MDSIIYFFRLEEGDNSVLFWMKEILVALLILALFWGAARFLRYLLVTWGPRFTSFTATDLDDRIIRRITPPASLLVICAGLYYAVDSLPLPDKVKLVVSGAIFVVNVAILTNIAYRMADETLNWYASRVAERTGAGLNRQLIPLAEKLVSIFLVGTALIIILKHFNYDILSLVTALGIGSLAIGMAAKDTLANMISGFTLMIDRPFRIGDRIQLTGGQWGDVQDIGLRSTRIKTVDNTLLIIPNSELCNTILLNLAFPDVRAKGRINLGVAYGSDVDQVKGLLVAIAGEVAGVLGDPPPEAFFVSFGDSALNMSLFFWVEDYTRVFPVTDLINSRIIKRFREEGIEIPYPIRTVKLDKQFFQDNEST